MLQKLEIINFSNDLPERAHGVFIEFLDGYLLTFWSGDFPDGSK
jgi:hypothetical protein